MILTPLLPKFSCHVFCLHSKHKSFSGHWQSKVGQSSPLFLNMRCALARQFIGGNGRGCLALGVRKLSHPHEHPAWVPHSSWQVRAGMENWDLHTVNPPANYWSCLFRTRTEINKFLWLSLSPATVTRACFYSMTTWQRTWGARDTRGFR